MSRKLVLILLGLLLLNSCGNREESAAEVPPTFLGAWLDHRQQAGFDAVAIEAQILHLTALGYSWIALAPTPQIADPFSPALVADPHDEDLVSAIRLAKSHGLKVFLCPRLESPCFFRAEEPLWRGDIAMQTEADWESFHRALENLLLGYAALAETEGVELFSLGLEYRQSTTRFAARWREMVKRVRTVYSGPLTYSANWYEEYREIEFWDALDYIGLGAYFPIAKEEAEDRQAMRAAWALRQRKLEAWAKGVGRPLLYTELGYPGVRDAGLRPWQWGQAGEALDHEHQADCFRAYFDVCRLNESFRGFFIWRYEADSNHASDYGYSPQGRPAERAIRKGLAGQNNR